ncbi:hypothetical protein Tco_0422157 [Tanacetum coccineum]
MKVEESLNVTFDESPPPPKTSPLEDDDLAEEEAIKFLQQLQPKWSRSLTIVKQTQDLDTVSYHKLFDILKQYQKEVNEICAEKIAKNANQLALVATAQQYPDTYYLRPKPHRSYAPPAKTSPSTRSHATTRHKGKEIAKPITPPSESASKEDSDPKQAQRDGNNVDTTLRYMNKNWTGQFGNQKTVTVAGVRETVTKKGKRLHLSQGQMLLCKQAEKGILLQAEQKSGSDAESLEKVQYDDEYNVFANERQHFDQAKSINDTHVVEKDDSNVILDSLNMYDNDNQADQNAKECARHDKEVELEKYKFFKDRIIVNDTLERKLKETLGLLAQKEHDIKEVCKEKASTVFQKEREQYFEIQDLKAQLQDKNIAISELKKLIEKCKGKSVETKFDKPSVVRQPNAQRIPKP